MSAIQEQIKKLERQLEGNVIPEKIKSAVRKKLEQLKGQIDETPYVKDEDVDTLSAIWTPSYVDGKPRPKRYFSFNENQLDYYKEIKQYGTVGYEGEKNGIYFYVLEIGNIENQHAVDELYRKMLSENETIESVAKDIYRRMDESDKPMIQIGMMPESVSEEFEAKGFSGNNEAMSILMRLHQAEENSKGRKTINQAGELKSTTSFSYGMKSDDSIYNMGMLCNYNKDKDFAYQVSYSSKTGESTKITILPFDKKTADKQDNFTINASEIEVSSISEGLKKCIYNALRRKSMYEEQETANALIKSEQKNKKPDITAQFENQFYRNEAIEQLIDWNIENENGKFTLAEMKFLETYTGYGGLQDITKKLGVRKEGIMTEYYTPDDLIQTMWGLAYKFGFKNGGAILENSVGIGRFLKYAPEDSEIDAFEMNKYSYLICKILYPDVNIRHIPYEQNFVNEQHLSVREKVEAKYDLVIGNPPYGKFESTYSSTEKKYTKANNMTEYFIARSLDQLKSGGLLVYVIGASIENGGIPFLDSMPNEGKNRISQKADLIDAYRLGNEVFEGTSVLADIVVFRKK